MRTAVPHHSPPKGLAREHETTALSKSGGIGSHVVGTSAVIKTFARPHVSFGGSRGTLEFKTAGRFNSY